MATAAEQRALWLDVGLALVEGKAKENRKPGQKFSEWVQEKFPGLSDKTASDAIWWAANSGVTPEKIPSGLSHPENIREWFNEQQATQALPADTPEITVDPAPKFKEKRDATKFIKVDQRAG